VLPGSTKLLGQQSTVSASSLIAHPHRHDSANTFEYHAHQCAVGVDSDNEDSDGV